jgi:hypothetical protein
MSLLKASGFVIQEARYVDSLGFLASLAYRALGNRSGTIDIKALRFFDRFIFPLSLAVDVLASPFFGKNLLVVARRP